MQKEAVALSSGRVGSSISKEEEKQVHGRKAAAGALGGDAAAAAAADDDGGGDGSSSFSGPGAKRWGSGVGGGAGGSITAAPPPSGAGGAAERKEGPAAAATDPRFISPEAATAADADAKRKAAEAGPYDAALAAASRHFARRRAAAPLRAAPSDRMVGCWERRADDWCRACPLAQRGGQRRAVRCIRAALNSRHHQNQSPCPQCHGPPPPRSSSCSRS